MDRPGSARKTTHRAARAGELSIVYEDQSIVVVNKPAGLLAVPAPLRLTLTYDQGKEMARHKELAAITGLRVYFADPHAPWQRGSNENTNGLLRQYFPKGSDLSIHPAEELQRVADILNDRPRKTLGWSSPAERLAALLRVGAD